MSTTSHLYKSSFGWVMSLAPGWQCLTSDIIPDSKQPVSNVVTFFPSQDSLVSLSWMYTIKSVPEAVSSAFVRGTTTTGPRNPAEAASLIESIYPLLGTITNSQVLLLLDGSRALELEESFVQEATGEDKNSYQLIFPIHGRPTSPVRFQRLCLYATQPVYKLWANDAINTARSFHYRHPFSTP